MNTEMEKIQHVLLNDHSNVKNQPFNMIPLQQNFLLRINKKFLMIIYFGQKDWISGGERELSFFFTFHFL